MTRILITGTRSKAYPESGVRLAFDYVRTVIDDLTTGQPVVIVHGKCPSGVDDIADRLAPEYGWLSEGHPADWPRCSPLCKALPPDHRRTGYGNYTYCPNAGFWRNGEMVDLHHDPDYGPYRLCVALPSKSWQTSPGTKNCYDRARAAGIDAVALNTLGHAFINQERVRNG